MPATEDSSSDGNGDVNILLDGVNLPSVEIHRMVPDDQLGKIELMQMQVERMQQWVRYNLKATMRQYDEQLARVDLGPQDAVKLIEAKTRALSILAENTTRMQMALDREQSRRIEKLKSSTRVREAAARMLETNRKALRLDKDWNQAPMTQPKVKMFVPGVQFRATVGVQKRADTSDWPAPP